MMVPPLSERPVTEEDEERFRQECARKYTLRRRWADYRAEVKARRPKGARARAAPFPEPTRGAVGVARPRAQGQATTNTATAAVIAL